MKGNGKTTVERRKMVPLDKQSPKQRAAFYASQRGSWGGMSPVTRVRPSGKAYDRRKMRGAREDWD